MPLLTRCWFFLLLCLLPLLAPAQQKIRFGEGKRVDSHLNDRTVSFTEFLDALANVKEVTFFRNIKIEFNRAIDKKGMDYRWANGGPHLHVRHDVFFYDCTFDREFWMMVRDMTFHGLVSFYNCNDMKANFRGCEFKNAMRFFSNEFDFMEFDSCTFRHGFRWERGYMRDRLKFYNCKMGLSAKFLPESYGPDMEARTLKVHNKIEELELTLERCHIVVPDSLQHDPQYYVTITGSQLSNLRILDCTFDAGLNLTQSSVSNLFRTVGCRYNQPVVIDALNLNPVNTKVDWSTLAGYKLALITPDNRILNGRDTALLHSNERVHNLISCYANLYNAFKTQGNRLAANASYVEWKNMETAYLKQEARLDTDGSSYFIYLLNLFLREFCDYGTNPLKSLLISAWVLALFALVYFFYPWQLGMQGPSFYTQLHILARYLSSPRRLTEVVDEPKVIPRGWHTPADMQGAGKQPNPSDPFSQFISEQPQRVPFYFRLFTHLDMRRWTMQGRVQRWLIRQADLLPGEWYLLPRNKRWRYSLFYGLIVLGLFATHLGARILDSLALSLNVFSTLGFGQIPISGPPRYLTILEGFVGWFLLSIFSVSLISQVIQ